MNQIGARNRSNTDKRSESGKECLEWHSSLQGVFPSEAKEKEPRPVHHLSPKAPIRGFLRDKKMNLIGARNRSDTDEWNESGKKPFEDDFSSQGVFQSEAKEKEPQYSH